MALRLAMDELALEAAQALGELLVGVPARRVLCRRSEARHGLLQLPAAKGLHGCENVASGDLAAMQGALLRDIRLLKELLIGVRSLRMTRCGLLAEVEVAALLVAALLLLAV